MLEKGKVEEGIGNIALIFFGGMVFYTALTTLSGGVGGDSGGEPPVAPVSSVAPYQNVLPPDEVAYLEGPYQEYEQESQEKAVRAAGLDQPRRQVNQDRQDAEHERYEAIVEVIADIPDEEKAEILSTPGIEELRETQAGQERVDVRGVYAVDVIEDKVVTPKPRRRSRRKAPVEPIIDTVEQNRVVAPRSIDRIVVDKAESEANYERVVKALQVTTKSYPDREQMRGIR